MLVVAPYGERIGCQKCSARIGTLLDDRIRVKVGEQFVETTSPLSISCPRCRYVNDIRLTNTKDTP